MLVAFLLCLPGIALLLIPHRSFAQSTWNGGGGDNNWTTGANWGGTAPVAGAALSFGGTTRLTPTNDFAADTLFTGITFNSGAGAFTLGGNRIKLGGNIVNNDDSTQTIGLDLAITATRTINATTAPIVINGVVSQSGGTFGLTTNGSVTLGASNTYAGATTISSGTLTLSGAGAISDSSAVSLSAASSVLDISGITASSETIASLAGASGSSVVLGGKTLIAGGGSTFSGSMSGTGGSFTKTGAGTFILSGASLTQTGTTTVSSGAINLTNNSSITGGTLSNSATGTISVTAGSTATIGGTLTNAAGGQITVGANGATLILQGGGTYTNNGNISLNGDATTFAFLKLTGDVTLGGTGTLTFSSPGNERIIGNLGTERLTNSVGHTIQGRGDFSSDGIALTNNGLILSNAGAGSLFIDPNAAGAINSATGVMRATSGSVLTFSSGSLANAGLVESLGTVNLTSATVDNTGGTIQTSGTGTLTLTNSSITGGSISNSSTGTISIPAGSTTTIGGTLTNAAGGQITVGANGATLNLQSGGTYTNNGNISLNGDATTFAFLKLTGDVTLGGTGTLTFSSPGNERIIGNLGTERLTNSAGHTIQGRGDFSSDGIALTNNGLILSNAGAGSLFIDPNASGAINSATGVMRATSGSVLTFSSGSLANAGLVESLGTVNLTSATVDNTGGTIRAAGGILNVTSTSISGGAVEMTGAGSLNLSAGTISGGTVTNSGTGAIAATAGTASTISSAVTLSGSNSISASSTRTLNLTGGIAKDAVTTTFLGTGAINVSGTGISGASANSNIIVSGAGTALTLSAVNTYGGSTTLTGGNLILSGVGTIPDSSAVNLSGAATLNISGITAAGEAIGSLAGISGSFVVLGGKTLTAGGDGTSTSYAGNISGTLGSLAKAGAGTMTLSGTNTYTGTTTVSAGTMQFSKQTALYNNTAASWTAAKIVVESGATLALNVGGTGEFTSANLDTIKAIGTASGGFKSGSILGLDTTNAAGGTFTYGTAIANTNGGANVVGLTKLGVNTLSLTGANTYTGDTTISGGSVFIDGSGSLSPSSQIILENNTLLRLTRTSNMTQGTHFGIITGDGRVTVGASSGSNVTYVLNQANTYTGATSTRSILEFNSIQNADGTASALGAPTDASNGTILMGATSTSGFTPTLRYTGTGNTTDRVLNLRDSLVAVEQAGSGLLKFTSSLTTTYDAAKTLTLSGSTSGVGEIAGAIVNFSVASPTSLIKSGTGKWVLSGASSYTGATSIQQGTLEVSANGALGTGAAGTTVSSGAALNLNGVSYTTAEALSINGTGISGGGALVNTGTSSYAGQVTAATNATINAGGGTLTLTGGLVKNGTTLTIAGGGSVIVNTTGISGASANSDLVVDGTTLVVNANSNYNGPTTVQNSGTLVANATVTTTALTVTTDSTLSGTGVIANGAGLVTMNGALIVGDTTLGSPVVSDLEISGTGSTVLGASSTLSFDLFTRGGDLTADPSSADRLRLFGTLDATLGGTLVLGNPSALTGFAAGDKWKLFDLQGGASISGALSLNYSALSLGPTLTGFFDSGTGVFSIDLAPEPGRTVLLMLGLCSLLLSRRRARQS